MRSVSKITFSAALASLMVLLSQVGNAQSLAFPGAEGYGRFTTGGRGGEVIYVTNLNDSGPGSLRAAIETEGPRIVVFGVSGNIALKSELQIEHGDLTLAGQSAPGDGITVKDYPVIVDADNVIIRYMRFRLGDVNQLESDAIGGRGIKNFILDHCSVSWAIDEAASFYTNEDVTLQWNIISESLNYSHHEKGDHGYGGIWGAVRGSFHHNLIAHHTSRNPRFSGSNYESDIPNRQVDFRNNVIYNWGDNSIYGGEDGEHNMVKNYFKPGPATQEDVADRIVNPSRPYGKFYVADNFVEGYPEVTEDNWAGGVQCEHPDSAYHATPFDYAPITEHEPEVVFNKVLEYAGASLQRDPLDTRVIREVRTGTARYHGSRSQKPGIIDSQDEVGGWPKLQSEPAPKDSDRDGMPDKWERKHGLDATDTSDGKEFTLHKDYTNVEVYLNELVNPITEPSLSK
ncbi:hypothetical protein NC796_19450 [Aliifodinibius sp. S!AR15-10]|uniref:pectate lyase family protein n=1 Tax=Aliifodinibius sp. S!AR15-10 TaxID=2950437 RepID=UPI002863B742|nr:hypothetical protein [Aliifodinibius sp. S!AR15-10]MDR8393339.1 hypothetical protein [Aliifodinibius sp. S!AR15-10]